MGAPARYDREGQDPSWRRPAEDMGEGCPGSWYRSAFVDFVLQYRRRPTEGGGRVENTRLTRCDDRLVHEWIALLESYEDAAHGEFLAKASGR